MSTISITSGGIDAKLTGPTTDTAIQPRDVAPTAPAGPKPGLSGDTKAATGHTAEAKPDANDLEPLTNDEVSSLVADLQRALTSATKPPLQVDFRQDDRSHGFVIEIRTERGDLVRQFPPEIVLNLRSKLDELSGMVIDQVT